MFQVIEAVQPGPKVEVVGQFGEEALAVSYAMGQQQVRRGNSRLWFVRQQGHPPSWVVDSDGLRRKPTSEEIATFFPS
jgi:hypothetical protein